MPLPDGWNIEMWSCDREKVHVYKTLWRDDHNGAFACVIDDFTIEQVLRVMDLEKWGQPAVMASPTSLRNTCHELTYHMRESKVALTRTQLGKCDVDVSELTDLDVAWLAYKAQEIRLDAARYAVNPFIDPIRFNSDDLLDELILLIEGRIKCTS